MKKEDFLKLGLTEEAAAAAEEASQKELEGYVRCVRQLLRHSLRFLFVLVFKRGEFVLPL